MVFKLSEHFIHAEELAAHLLLSGHRAEVIPSVGCCIDGLWTTSNEAAMRIMDAVLMDFCNTFKKVAE